MFRVIKLCSGSELGNLPDKVLDIHRASCVFLRQPLTSSTVWRADHVTVFLRAGSPEITETVHQNGPRDGTMSSGSFPITSLIISRSLWIAVMQHDSSL